MPIRKISKNDTYWINFYYILKLNIHMYAHVKHAEILIYYLIYLLFLIEHLEIMAF